MNEDGFTDCEDLGCDGVVIDSGGGPVMCESLGEISCEDGFDNDSNGLNGLRGNCLYGYTFLYELRKQWVL